MIFIELPIFLSLWIERSEVKKPLTQTHVILNEALAKQWIPCKSYCHSDDCEGGRISKETGIFQEIPRIRLEWHLDYCPQKTLSFWTECSGVKNLPRNEFIVRSLTYVRDDKYVILKGFALKNLPPSESTIATVTNRTVEIPHTRPQVSVRNDIIVILNAAWAEWRISNKLQKIPHIHSEW